MSKLLDYLNTIDSDAAARQAHAADPKAAMTQFGLTEEEQLALASGDTQAIAKLCGVEPSLLPPPQISNTPFN
ncbi:MAG: hypothetical protein CFE43_07740 [Burkholderiales bacterium PBB3]|nr:MAG: hypothetical protein CFE43_07740 [Burkholderiales bacterium PBB3]